MALHVESETPAGAVALRGGFLLANVDSVDIEVFGRGGHGAAPDKTIDPIVQAAELVLSLQTIVSREVKPTDQPSLPLAPFMEGLNTILLVIDVILK